MEEFMISYQLASGRTAERSRLEQARSDWPHHIWDTPILDQTCLDQPWQSAIASASQATDLRQATDLQPQFHLNQRVYFVGGCGTVKYCQPYAQTWTYAVEMELGPEPEMGRIGSEATILLYESEIQGLVDAAS
jgi:hypothetical protein